MANNQEARIAKVLENILDQLRKTSSEESTKDPLKVEKENEAIDREQKTISLLERIEKNTQGKGTARLGGVGLSDDAQGGGIFGSIFGGLKKGMLGIGALIAGGFGLAKAIPAIFRGGLSMLEKIPGIDTIKKVFSKVTKYLGRISGIVEVLDEFWNPNSSHLPKTFWSVMGRVVGGIIGGRTLGLIDGTALGKKLRDMALNYDKMDKEGKSNFEKITKTLEEFGNIVIETIGTSFVRTGGLAIQGIGKILEQFESTKELGKQVGEVGKKMREMTWDDIKNAIDFTPIFSFVEKTYDEFVAWANKMKKDYDDTVQKYTEKANALRQQVTTYLTGQTPEQAESEEKVKQLQEYEQRIKESEKKEEKIQERNKKLPPNTPGANPLLREKELADQKIITQNLKDELTALKLQQIADNKEIFDITRKFESGKGEIFAAGKEKNKKIVDKKTGEITLKEMGYSLGNFQISSETMPDFLEYIRPLNPEIYNRLTAKPGSDKFVGQWYETANTGNYGEELRKREEEFIYKRKFTPAVDQILKDTGVNIKLHSKALQSLVLSTANQFGETGAANIFKEMNDYKKLSTMRDEDIMDLLMQFRMNKSPSTSNRYISERDIALKMLEAERNQKNKIEKKQEEIIESEKSGADIQLSKEMPQITPTDQSKVMPQSYGTNSQQKGPAVQKVSYNTVSPTDNSVNNSGNTTVINTNTTISNTPARNLDNPFRISVPWAPSTFMI